MSAQPRSLNPSYLRGWFLLETRGNARLAAKLANEYLARVRANKQESSSCST